MAKISRKSKENHVVQFPKLNVFVCQKSILRHITFKILKIEFKFKYAR